MNRCTWQAVIVQEIVKEIGLAFVVYKDDCAGRWHGHEQVVQSASFFILVNEYYLRYCK